MRNKLKLLLVGVLLFGGILMAGSDGDLMPLNQLIGAGMLVAGYFLMRRCEL